MHSPIFMQEIQNRNLIGTWIQIASPDVVEIVGHAGFDFVVIDTEHTSFGIETADILIRAAECVALMPFVRVSHKDPTLVMKALDAGAQGIVYPGVSEREDAEQAVKASKYPPLGERGACPFVRSGGHHILDWEAYAEGTNKNTAVILLLEGKEGVDNLEDIVAVKGIDVIMLGPFDLSVSLGVGGQLDHPLVMEKSQEIVRLAKRQGISIMSNIFDTDFETVSSMTKHWFSIGCRSLLLNGDKSILSTAMLQNFQTLDSLRVGGAQSTRSL